jgi:hypothetical protein
MVVWEQRWVELAAGARSFWTIDALSRGAGLQFIEIQPARGRTRELTVDVRCDSRHQP